MKRILLLIFSLTLVIPCTIYAAVNVPAGLAVIPTDTTIKVTWTANEDDTDSYIVSWGTTLDLNYSTIVRGKTNTEHTIAGLTPDSTYYVQLSAHDDAEGATATSTAIQTATEPSEAASGVSVPENFNYNPEETAIVLTWTANTENTDSYTISWDTTSWNTTGDPQDTHNIDDITTTSYTIEDLIPNQTYYVQITAKDAEKGETAESDIQQTKTDNPGLSSVPKPSDFDVTRNADGSPSGITQNSVNLTWSNVSHNDFSSYIVTYGTGSNGYSMRINEIEDSNVTISKLTKSTRYYFIVNSVDKDGNESPNSDEIIVDTKTDLSKPNTPEQPEVVQSGPLRIYISFDEDSSGMVDIKGHKVHIANNNDHELMTIDIEDETSVSIGKYTDYEQFTFSENKTYKVSLSAYDYDGNRSAANSESMSVSIERVQNILVDNEELKNSCFISSLAHPENHFGKILFALICLISVPLLASPKTRLFMTVCIFISISTVNSHAELNKKKNNSVGIKVGYTYYMDTLIKDTYEDDHPVSGSLFYERILYGGLFADIEVGFLRLDGKMLTENDTQTAIDSELSIFPISMSLGYKHYFTNFVFAYFGAGPDLWQFHEVLSVDTARATQNRNFSGYHAKLGIGFLTKNIDLYKNVGIQFEVSYSEIDGYKENDINFGGLTFHIGYCYKF